MSETPAVKHAERSPSGASRWMACPGSVAFCRGIPDPGSKYADEGTDAHELAATCLIQHKAAHELKDLALAKGFPITDEMILAVQKYIDVCIGIPGTRLIEQSLPLEFMTAEADAQGTADCVIVAGSELVVIDLKYGRGVSVDAEDNPQLLIYGAAALEQFGHIAEFSTLRVMIVQPRMDHVSEAVYPVEHVRHFVEVVRAASLRTQEPDAPLVPGEEQCRFCRGKATCPALQTRVIDMFDALPADQVGYASDVDLARSMRDVELIEGWCKAIRGEIETRLLAGAAIEGWKLVQGKQGNRAWSDETEVERLLKDSMRVKHDVMYSYKLISPTQAQKVLKPRQWAKIGTYITQKSGQPSVAPASDKRPAINSAQVAEQFEVLT